MFPMGYSPLLANVDMMDRTPWVDHSQIARSVSSSHYKGDLIKQTAVDRNAELVKDPYGLTKKQQKNYRPRYQKWEDFRDSYNEARGRITHANHSRATADYKHPAQPKVNGDIYRDYKRRSQLAKEQVTRTANDIAKRNVVKGKTASSPIWKRASNIKGLLGKGGREIIDVFKGRRGFLLQAAAITGTFMLARRMAMGTNEISTVPSVNPMAFDRRAAYLPASYKEGYKDIKQSLTDFGSRVDLDKTVTRVNVTPQNSTRNAPVTTTNAVINGNLALNLANNAINHTRY